MGNTDYQYSVQRHDHSSDKSLKAWSAADEYLLNYFNELEVAPEHIGIYHDRFGYLTCQLNAHNTTTIITHKSQEKAIQKNLEANQLPSSSFHDPISALSHSLNLALIKAPKSLDLFQLYLEHVYQYSTEDVTVVCAFMTRHFTPQLISIAETYFDSVVQSRAVKKARLLILKGKKKSIPTTELIEIPYHDKKYQQYPGVFSANHIDYATQFLVEHLKVNDHHQRILDLASGNGVIAGEIQTQLPLAEIHLLDDAWLAVASGKLNVSGKHVYHHFDDNLSVFEDHYFDLIVTNPPFHFEYETNINIPITLFKAAYQCLKTDGVLQIVANKHLNYKTHLAKTFPKVEIMAENEKFVIYQCTK